VFGRGLCEVFTFAGEVPHSRIPLYVAAMDIAIIPDFNTYGSPMKLFEYMAMRKAIVAPDVPPIREVIEDGKTGILFERGNVAQALEGIERLIENEQLRHDLGRRARAKVVRSYTWDQNAERIANIAESMM
jgi:glycosyltransferase involved in cell wall biosynthesis